MQSLWSDIFRSQTEIFQIMSSQLNNSVTVKEYFFSEKFRNEWQIRNWAKICHNRRIQVRFFNHWTNHCML